MDWVIVNEEVVEEINRHRSTVTEAKYWLYEPKVDLDALFERDFFFQNLQT